VKPGQLKRGKPLERKTPMSRKNATLTRNNHVKRASKSPNEFSPEVKAEAERRSGGICEARTPVCTTRATRHHHIRLRRCGDNSASNDLHVCDPCHLYIHANPEISYDADWLRKVNGAG